MITTPNRAAPAQQKDGGQRVQTDQPSTFWAYRAQAEIDPDPKDGWQWLTDLAWLFAACAVTGLFIGLGIGLFQMLTK